jgi:hypothetical protein
MRASLPDGKLVGAPLFRGIDGIRGIRQIHVIGVIRGIRISNVRFMSRGVCGRRDTFCQFRRICR